MISGERIAIPKCLEKLPKDARIFLGKPVVWRSLKSIELLYAGLPPHKDFILEDVRAWVKKVRREHQPEYPLSYYIGPRIRSYGAYYPTVIYHCPVCRQLNLYIPNRFSVACRHVDFIPVFVALSTSDANYIAEDRNPLILFRGRRHLKDKIARNSKGGRDLGTHEIGI